VFLVVITENEKHDIPVSYDGLKFIPYVLEVRPTCSNVEHAQTTAISEVYVLSLRRETKLKISLSN
jgi:hypothetical protein